jgi:hypothetical protein
MRKLILSALLLASAFQTAFGTYISGDYIYQVFDDQATITDYTGAGGAVTIPSTLNSYPVVSIESNAFINSALTSVSIPNSVTSIGSGAFANCPSLASVIIPNSVTSIGSNAFSGTALISVSIPNSVTSIGESAFEQCSSLASVSIPYSVTSIGSYAFSGTALTSVSIPYGVTSIGNGAFSYCYNLTSVTIPNSVTSLGAVAFYGCLGLGSVFLSPNLSSSQITQAQFHPTALFYVGSVGAPISMATQAELATTQAELASTKAELATTKSQITTAINEGKASGIASVTASPNTWSLFTSSQIQNMAVGDLVLNRQVDGSFVLNYDIEQSTDLQTWTPYQALSLPLTGLPTDKAFVRIKAKQ